MKLNKLIFLIMIFLLVLNSGCTYGNYTVTKSVAIDTFSKMYMSYKKFNGYKAAEINVKEGEQYQVNVSIVTKDGKLGLTIALKNDEKDKQDESIYEGNELPDCNFKITLDKPGKYIIKVTGEDHSGSYEITWNKVEN